MILESWLPALLGYLLPVGLFLVAWGGMAPQKARRMATVGSLALALATLGYFAVGFAFHLGGAKYVQDLAGVTGLDYLYGAAGWGLIGLKGFFLSGDAVTPTAMALFVIYLPLVATAVLLVVLSVSDRAHGWQVALGGLVVGAVLFPLAACWAWGGGWLAYLGRAESVGIGHGFVDHAGSGVVYLLGGLAALGALLALGQRVTEPEDVPAHVGRGEPMPPAHFPLLANLGALLFGLGGLGWSLSIPFHAAGAGLGLERIAVNVLLGGAGAVLAAQTYAWMTAGRADPLMSARGAVAGFVAVAAGAPFVRPWSALLVGVLAGLLLPLGVYLVDRVLRLPDATATVSIGIIAGLLGLLAVPLFADGLEGQGWNGVGLDEYLGQVGMGVTGFFPAESFAVGGGRGQIMAQLAGIGAIGLLAFAGGWLTFTLLNIPYRSPLASGDGDEID